AGDELHALPRAGVEVTAQPGADPGVRLARVHWRPTAASRLGGADQAATAAAIRRAMDLATLAAAAQLLGLGTAMLDMAVRYAGQREQFGRAIGAFQAVKHRLADVYVALEFARPAVARAAWSASRGLATRSRDASMAKHCATRAAQLAGQVALQTHGAIGYTYEHDLHMWLKRTWTLAALWGDEAWHLERVAVAVLDDHQPRVP
ncbi:MAG: acyl-CoA dehydrogenase family protein, partial [Mycobacteriales bacterium]